MNNSILIIFLIVLAVLARAEYKKYLVRTGKDSKEFRSLLRLRLNDIGNRLLVKIGTAVIIAFIVSLVSFREIWSNDVFHVTFLALLLAGPVHKSIKKIIE